ncbi:MAG: HAD-IC family P-type ATPase [Hymenobacteraceae bacterium]|nr:HAD-IC family P-type ATPase [Hymenobacteraceae bacterium]
MTVNDLHSEKQSKESNLTATSSSQSWHSLPADDVLDRLNTSSSGLTTTEAKKRLKASGPNVLRKQRQISIIQILLRQIKNPLIYVLLAATLLAFGMGKITDAMVILSVVVINTIIGFIQEYQAGKTIQALLRMAPEQVTVMREGEQRNIPASELVQGDYVLLQAGDRISADLRLAFVKNLQCDEASLTGESLPVTKSTEPVEEDSIPGDRTCMAYRGTFVTAGTGEGIVVATASDTEIGKISEMLETAEEPETPLTRSISKVANWITISILVVGVVVLGIGILRGYSFAGAAFSAITLAVATIPEGLPAVITIASAIGVRRMAKRNSVIRHLPAVETLGSTTVICSDKTGTLTRNEMTVKVLWNGENYFDVTGIGIEPEGEILHTSSGEEAQKDHVGELIRAGVLCNDASLEKQEDGNWKAVGDPTEIALVTASRKLGIDEGELREKWTRLDEHPFDSARKIMATLHSSPDGGKVVYVKGAPEAVLRMLGDSKNINPKKISEEALKFAESGLRVLAFASKELDDSHSESITDDVLQGGFQFLGLQAMQDPPRIEVKEAIDTCHQAGVIVKMITGDHPGTAAAIAQELGLMPPDQEVITGKQLQEMDEREYQEAVQRTNVFARVSPEHKLKLVKALQANGEVVAMTGDGVNDAPALKRADIGVAMGITGTAVAKEAADMILTDDNFESIEAAVEEGRRVYDNLIKSIVFLLPTSIGLGLVIFVSVLFFPSQNGIPLQAMQPVQVLWINLITAVALSLPLALEVMEPDTMNRPPREPDAPILSGWIFYRMVFVAMLMAGGTLGLFLREYYVELENGTAPTIAIAEAQTLAVTTMVLFQSFYLVDCRSLKYPVTKIGLLTNPMIYAGIAVVLLTQLAFVYFPFMNRWFHSLPLKADAWAISFAVAFSVLPVISFEKWIRARKDS